MKSKLTFTDIISIMADLEKLIEYYKKENDFTDEFIENRVSNIEKKIEKLKVFALRRISAADLKKMAED